VSRGEEDWIPLLEKFWKPFKATIDDKSESVDRTEATGARLLGNDPKTGKPINARLGRYGPFVQIGTAEDEEKPTFASLRPGQSIFTITMDEALKLFTLPRKLGELDGKELSVAIGRFGPFVKRGDTYASLDKLDDPYEIDFERGAALIRAREELIANRLIRAFDDSAIQVLNGTYGPYIPDGEKTGQIPKDRVPKSLTLEECLAILAAAPMRPQRGRFGKKATSKTATRKAAAKKAKAADGEAAPAKKVATKKVATKKAATKKTPAKKAATRKTAAEKKPATRRVSRPLPTHVPAPVLATPAPFRGVKRLVKKEA
jgi:DNA topoisomerase-1